MEISLIFGEEQYYINISIIIPKKYLLKASLPIIRRVYTCTVESGLASISLSIARAGSWLGRSSRT